MANITNYGILHQQSFQSHRKKIQFTTAGFLQAPPPPDDVIILKGDSELQPSCSSNTPAASTSASSNATPDSITEDLTNVPSPSDLRRRLIETSNNPESTKNETVNGATKPDVTLQKTLPFIGPQRPTVTNENNRKRRASESLEEDAVFPILDGQICQDGWKNFGLVNNRQHACGLYNELNDCFLNAVVQSVVHTPQLTRYLYDHPDGCLKRMKNEKCFYCAMKTLIIRLVTSSNPIQTRSVFRPFMHEIFPSHRFGAQEDAHEMLCLLLSALEPKNIANGTHKIPHKTSTPIEQIFGGTLKNQYSCESCKTVSTNYEYIREINLGLRLKRYEGRTNLSEIVNDYFQPERIHSFLCKLCKVKRIAVRTTCIVRPPTVLIIQLKRFNAYGAKIGLPVSPETTLNLSEYMYNNEMTSYKLNGVISHLGFSVNSGHYIAAMRGFDGQSWFKYDDDLVTKISPDNARSIQPYILFYIKQNIQVSLPNKPSPKLNQTTTSSLVSNPGPSQAKLPKFSPFKIENFAKSQYSVPNHYFGTKKANGFLRN